MRALSLFSGVGGLDLGLERAGITTVALCEIDKHARSVLARHWPNIPIYDDVTTFDARSMRGTVDLVHGGSPCQDLSVAGRRAGLDGQRSGLFWHQCRIAAEVAAPWVLWENVAGALSSNSGRDFSAVLWGLTGTRPDVPAGGWRNMGVVVGPQRAAVWRLLDARWFGVPQRRRRVFVVSGPRAVADRVVEVLLEPESSERHPRQSAAARQDIAGTLGGGTPGGGPKTDTDRMTFVPVSFVKVVRSGARDADGNLPPEVWAERDVAPTLNQMDNGGESRATVLAVSELPNADDTAKAGKVIATIQDARDINKAQNGLGIGRGDDPMYTLDTTGAQGVAVLAVSENQRGELRLTDYARQITTGGGKPGQGYPAVLANLATTPAGQEGNALAVRRLTPVECERLMGWPDNWTRWAADGTDIADSHRYRMCGNGVVSNVTEWIGERLVAAHASAADAHATPHGTPHTTAHHDAHGDAQPHTSHTAETQGEPSGSNRRRLMADHRHRPERPARGEDRSRTELAADRAASHLSDDMRLSEGGAADAQHDIADGQVTDSLGGGVLHAPKSTTNTTGCQPQTRGAA